MSGDDPRGGRTGPEWITFGISLLVLALLVGLIARDLFEPEDPADPVAELVGAAERRGEQFVVTVEVRNQGDRAAVDVQVLAELRLGEEVLDADQVIDHLPGAAKEEIEMVFDQDPAGGELTARVTGFQHP